MPWVKRISWLVRCARTSSLPHQPSPIIAAFSMLAFPYLFLPPMRAQRAPTCDAELRIGCRNFHMFKSVAEACGCAGLLQRMRLREGVDRHAGLDNPFHRRKRLDVDIEEACARGLADHTDVRHRHGVAMRELASLR